MSFYNHTLYQPTYTAVREALKEFLSEQVFRFDKSRVIVASNDFAFRRRYELTDMSKDFNNLKAMSLNLPFCNINPFNTGWEFDDAPASRNASLVYDGIYEGTTKIRASRVFQRIPCTFYFDNEADARLAYDRMHFLSYVEHDLSYDFVYGGKVEVDEDGNIEVKGGEVIKLPVVLEFKSLKFNPTFNEKSWLEQQRMFVLTAEIDARSFALYPLTQPKLEGTISASDYDWNDNAYLLTNKVMLGFGSDFKSSFYIKQTRDEFPEQGMEGVYYLSEEDNSFFVWDKSLGDYIMDGRNAFLVVTESDVYDAPWVITRELVPHENYVDVKITAEYIGDYEDDGEPMVTIDSMNLYLGTRAEEIDWEKNVNGNIHTYTTRFGVEYPSYGSEADVYDDPTEGYKVWNGTSWVSVGSSVTTVSSLDFLSETHGDGFEEIPETVYYVVEENEDGSGYHYQLTDRDEEENPFTSNIQDLEAPTEDMVGGTYRVYTYMAWSGTYESFNVVSRIYVMDYPNTVGDLGDYEVEVSHNLSSGDTYVRSTNDEGKDTRVVSLKDLNLLPTHGSDEVLYKMYISQLYIYRSADSSYTRANVMSPCFLKRGETYAGYIEVMFGGATKEEKSRTIVTVLETLPNEDDNRPDDLLEDWTPAVYDRDVLIDDPRVLSNEHLNDEHTIVGIHW